MAASARADEQGAQIQALIDKQAAPICTVKAVIKTEMKFGGQSQDQESRITLSGVCVDPDGIVMLSNMPLSPNRAMEMFGGGREGGDQFNMKASATGFKVTFEKEEKEYDAFLAATDTKLDLAFIKLEGLEGRKLPFVDFSSGTEAAIGQQVATVARLQKGYDYAAYIQTSRVTGAIAKPRKAWLLEGGVSELGLPVYSMTGQVIGVLTTIPAAGKDDSGDDSASFAMFMRMMSGGGMKMGGSFLVPAAPVNGVIELAKQRAVTVAAERAKKKAEAAAAPKKPAAGTPTTPPGTKPKKP